MTEAVRLQGGYATCMMVKKWICEIQSPHARYADGKPVLFRVFTTGDDRYVLFVTLDRWGCSTDVQFPVLRRNLRRGVLPPNAR